MAIARVQSVSSTTAAGAAATSLSLVFGAATTDGNVVMVAVNSTSVGQVKVTSAHGLFSDVTPQGINTSGTANQVRIFHGIMTGSDQLITIAFIASSRAAAVAVEYSGSHITQSDIPTNVQSLTATPNTAAITNSNANSLYVAALGQKGVNVATTNNAWCSAPTNSFNIVDQNTTSVNSGNAEFAVVYLDSIVSTSSARNVAVTSALGSLQSSGIMATFQEILTGGGIRTAGHGGLAA
jgi:hypothetical protein